MEYSWDTPRYMYRRKERNKERKRVRYREQKSEWEGDAGDLHSKCK